MSQQIEFDECRKKANLAVDLAVAELTKTHGGEVTMDGHELHRAINAVCRETSTKKETRIYIEDLKGLLRISATEDYVFSEERREERIGKVRPADLMIAGHFSSETLERFIVIDLEGDLSDQETRSYCVRFEAWCRLYYCSIRERWSVHYVDIIIRHKSPAERVLFMFEHSKSGEPVQAIEKDPDALCLFFKTLQGGMWG